MLQELKEVITKLSLLFPYARKLPYSLKITFGTFEGIQCNCITEKHEEIKS
jgi:hypothetical protein